MKESRENRLMQFDNRSSSPTRPLKRGKFARLEAETASRKALRIAGSPNGKRDIGSVVAFQKRKLPRNCVIACISAIAHKSALDREIGIVKFCNCIYKRHCAQKCPDCGIGIVGFVIVFISAIARKSAPDREIGIVKLHNRIYKRHHT